MAREIKRKCVICGEKFGTKYLNVKWCSVEHGYEHSLRLKEKKQESERKALKKELKAKLETSTELRKKLQEEINRIVRAIDYGQRCISSQKISRTLQAGHYFSRGSHPEIQFHLWNIHGQSVRDNYFEGGAQRRYRESLVKIYGVEITELIDNLPEMYRNLTWSKDELKTATETAKQIFKSLEKGKIYSIDERIELRKTINDKLNLYVI
jgi:hypothetical protein